MKCQDCGLPVHRNCRDSVTTECVRRRQNQQQQQLQQRKLDRSSSVALPSSSSGAETTVANDDRAGGECSAGSSRNSGNAGILKPQISKSGSMKRPLLSFLSRPRPQRAVSSISPTAEPSPPPSATLFPVGGPKLRSWSESADYFR